MKEFEVKLHFKVDKEVIGTAVGGDAVAHADDGVRTQYKEEFSEEVLQLRLCNGVDGGTVVLSGGMLGSAASPVKGSVCEYLGNEIGAVCVCSGLGKIRE